MIRLATKILLVLLPLLIIVGTYLYADPFEVIYAYDKHYLNPRISYNRDYVVTDQLMTNRRRHEYDSFILGNSRSVVFKCKDWNEHIQAKGTFHFDASGESLFGVHSKIKWLDAQGVRVKNCLIILDYELLSNVKNHEGHIGIKHPAVSKDSYVDFHLAFFKAYLNPIFFIGYWDSRITGKVRRGFDKKFEKRDYRCDPDTCDINYGSAEEEIAAGVYYNKIGDIFYARDERTKQYERAAIYDKQFQLLNDIRQLFRQHQTVYKIVVSPLYDQKYCHPSDRKALCAIFGADNVYDYSGINRFTSCVTNYYETSHYRPHVARAIMAEIYGPPQP
ncbi:MAG: hypothetical protein WCJ57_05015, partial [Candidatus Falkowbacteria bacterium]